MILYFCSKDNNSIFEVVNTFHKFSLVFGLKPNTTKWDVAWYWYIERGKCGNPWYECLNLIVETVKIIDEHFSYNKNIEKEMNFQSHVVKIEDILRLWRMRNLTNEGKVLDFISRITTVPHAIISQLNII